MGFNLDEPIKHIKKSINQYPYHLSPYFPQAIVGSARAVIKALQVVYRVIFAGRTLNYGSEKGSFRVVYKTG
jgi:hypothetical protein